MEEPESPDIASKEPLALHHELVTSDGDGKQMSVTVQSRDGEIIEETFEEDDDNDVKSFIDALREDLQDLRAKNRELKLENKKLKIEVSTITDKHGELQICCNQLTSERDEKLKGLEKNLSVSEVEIGELRKEIEEINKDRSRLESELECAQVDVLSSQTEQLQIAIREREVENAYLTRNIEQLNIDKLELEENLQQALTNRLSCEDKLVQLDTTLKENESQIRDLKLQATEVICERDNLQRNLQNALAEITELKHDLNTAQAKNNELQQEIIILNNQMMQTAEKEQAAMENGTVENKYFPSVYTPPNTDGQSESQKLKKELEGGVKLYIEKMQKRVNELEENNEKLESELRKSKAEIDSSDYAWRVNAELKAKIESQDDTIGEIRANNERLKTEVKENQAEIELANNAKERKIKMIDVLETKVVDLEAKLKKFELQPKEREEILQKENMELKSEIKELQNKLAELESQTRGLSRVGAPSASKRSEIKPQKSYAKRPTSELLYGPSVSQATTLTQKSDETDGSATESTADSIVVTKREKTKVGQNPSHYRHSYAGGTYPRPFVPVQDTKPKATISEQTVDDMLSLDFERRSSFHSDASGESETSAASESGALGFLRRPILPYKGGAKPFGVTTARPFYKPEDHKNQGEISGNRRTKTWADFNSHNRSDEQQFSSSECSSVISESEAEKSLVEERQIEETPVQCVHASPEQISDNWLEFTRDLENSHGTQNGEEREISFSNEEDVVETVPTRTCVVKDFQEESSSKENGEINNIVDETFSATEKPSQSFALPEELFQKPESSPRKKPAAALPIFKRTFKSPPPPREPPTKPEKFNYKTYMKSTLKTEKKTREDDSYVTQQPTLVTHQEKDHVEVIEQRNRSVKTFILENNDHEENAVREQANPGSNVNEVNANGVTKRESVNSLVNQWNKRVSVNFEDI